MSDFDIVVVGGGLVGAVLAAALTPRWHVALLESRPLPQIPEGAIAGGPWDERCIAVNDGSRRIFENFGLWSKLAPLAIAIRSTQISERGRFGTARFSAAEAGVEALGWNVPVRAVGAAAWQTVLASGIEVFTAAELLEARAEGDRICLQLRVEGADQEINAKLVVAADGAQSTVREKLGIQARTRDYDQQAIVTAVRIGRAHRDVAWERFTRDGPFAVLPKAADACSVVQTVSSKRCEELMALSDDAYLAQAQRVFGGRLGPFLELGRRMPHALSRVVSSKPVARRTVFVGNASQSLHPVAAQGFNLGLRDAANLAVMLASAQDPGSTALLDAFSDARREDRAAAAGFTDLLARAFIGRTPGLAQGRHWGLVGVQLLPGVHRRLLRQHLGHLGLPPGV